MSQAEQVVDGWKYRDGDVMLVQYIDGKTGNGFPDDFLVWLYRRSQQDGIMGMMFPGDDHLTLGQFVSRLSTKGLVVGLVKKPNTPAGELGYDVAGYGWLEERAGVEGGRKATVAYGFFKQYWGTAAIRAIARLAVRFWFEESGADVLFGVSRKTNTLTHRFSREVGFQFVADIPKFISRDGKLADATLFYMSKEQFLEREAGELWEAAAIAPKTRS